MASVNVSTDQSRHKYLKEWAGTGLRYLVPVAVTAALVVWILHKVDFHEVVRIVRQGCDFEWIFMMMGVLMLSRIVRGIRWGIQLRAAGVPRMPVTAECVSIFGAYALDLLFPWLGEAWRCVYVTKRENVRLSTVVGTDMGDRGSDAVAILIIAAVAMLVSGPAIEKFMSHYAVGKDMVDITENPWLWISLCVLAAIFWAGFHFFHNYKYIRKIEGSVRNAWKGFDVLFTMKGRWTFVWLTVLIWIFYFLQTYLCLYAFPFTRQLVTEPGMAWGLVPGLTVFVFGSFSIAVPSNGGLGPWNLAVMFALSLYGVSDAESAAYSLVVWSFQTIMIVALGIFSAIYVTYTSRNKGSLRKSISYPSGKS